MKLKKKTVDATGLSKRTVDVILAEKRSLGDGKFESPRKRYKKSRIRVDPDDFDVSAIRRTVHQFYDQRTYPTLCKLHSLLKERGLFSAGRTSLWKLLHKIGFSYRKINDKRYVYEQHRIINWRHKYLRRLRRNRSEGKTVIYLDETWANAHDGHERTWVKKDDASGGTVGGIRKPTGKGNRLIILHAGSSSLGWVGGAELVFQSKKSTGDYHDEMNSEHFESWFRDQLVPNIPPDCLIVMDNASYHSRRQEFIPKMNSRKSVMIDWLTHHNIEFPEKALKRELLELIKGAHPEERYAIDEIAKTFGHEVVCLPPYHCELNPIEMAWAQVKGYIKAKNSKFTLSHVKDLTYEGFSRIGKEDWSKLVEHTVKVEDKFWEMDSLHEEVIDEFVIEVGGSSSSEDDDSSDGFSSDSSSVSSDSD